MMKVHPDSEETQPISNLEKYADEIRDLQVSYALINTHKHLKKLGRSENNWRGDTINRIPKTDTFLK